MKDVSVLIGGRAGDGINSAGLVIAHLLNHTGYRVYMYFDYPSLIKGGHNYSIIRGSSEKVGAHRKHCDFLLALNQDSLDLHGDMVTKDTAVIYDSGRVKAEGTGLAISDILKAADAPAVMGNSIIIGAFARCAGMDWKTVESVFRARIPREVELNLKVARSGYDAASEVRKIEFLGQEKFPILTGNEAIGLGLVRGGLDAYIAYPMTPTSNILHFLAELAEDLPITVVHPENEIAVMLMALGFAYAGKKAAVGTSGGGFCLMTEAFSLAGMAELPTVVVMGQRTGPSTGVPTYTAQTDLHFMIHAGQGEFPRIVIAPGDAEQAYVWSSLGLALAWKYQVPAILLVDKTLCEGSYSFEQGPVPDTAPFPDKEGRSPHLRYAFTDNGVSPMVFPSMKDAVVKVNGYAHDQSGITTENAEMIRRMTDKRKQKEVTLKKEVESLDSVMIEGKPDASTAILCWGSNRGVCREVAGNLDMKMIQPVILWPFPEKSFRRAISGVNRIISVEDSACGQIPMLIARYGIKTFSDILRYDGRPFTVEELTERVLEVI